MSRLPVTKNDLFEASVSHLFHMGWSVETLTALFDLTTQEIEDVIRDALKESWEIPCFAKKNKKAKKK